MSDVQERFTQIYRDHEWGSSSRSGPGSDPERTKKYRTLIKHILQSHPIKSVVDVGCGDWTFSRQVDWGNVDYTGVDIVPDLVNQLNGEFGNNKRRFIVANLVEQELPAADLCIIKDVLQHLSNASVERFIHDQLPRFKFALLTNDARRTRLTHFVRPWKMQSPNVDIANGDVRAIRLNRPPFGLRAQQVAWYRMLDGIILVEKEVLFWQRATG